MEDSNRERPDAGHPGKLEDLRKLSQEFLRFVNLGSRRMDFMREVTNLLMDFSKCDEVELRLVENEKCYKYVSAVLLDRSFRHSVEPCIKAEETRIGGESMDLIPMDRLILDVSRGELDTSASFFTNRGSFWTGNTGDSFSYGLTIEGKKCERKLNIGGPYISLALIPIKTRDDDIGFLQLKSGKRNYFEEEEINVFEDIAHTLGVVLAYRSSQAALHERVKELMCLYNIAQVAEQPDISVRQLLQGIVELLPPAWQYPEITSSRIVLDGYIYVAPGFMQSKQKQAAEIIVRGERRGTVEVVYTEKKPEVYEGPFLKEERNLIDAVAREVALIIERKEAEEVKSKLQDQLRHADRLATIGQLAAGVAHELNEPLSNILGFAQLVDKDSGLSDQVEHDVDKIISATLHAREIVKKLMLFARQMPPEKVKVDLNQSVEEGIYFLGARCAKAGIELVCELANDLPVITADPSQLHQVLVNLAVNAMQAMPDGGTLTIRTLAGGDHVSLIIEDTGTGMKEEVMKQIFIPFFTTKDIDEGTGLGLAVVHGIVSSHEGTIEVDSRLDRGSRFEVRLPIEQQEETDRE